MPNNLAWHSMIATDVHRDPGGLQTVAINLSHPFPDVGLLEINAPQSHNALSPQTCLELTAHLECLHADLNCRVVVLTGAGEVFSAGADLGDPSASRESLLPALQKVMATIEQLPMPVVAAVNGPAVGAGVQLCLASDIRVVADKAYFQIPAVAIGLTVDSWTVRKAVTMLGAARAQELLLMGRKLDSEQATACGFASTRGNLGAALKVADDLAAFAPATLTHLKLAVNNVASDYVSDETVGAADSAVWESPEFSLGIAAAANGEPISFRGTPRKDGGTSQ
jgi:enoyl-CoA hydratase